jgi:hypothetical protein
MAAIALNADLVQEDVVGAVESAGGRSLGAMDVVWSDRRPSDHQGRTVRVTVWGRRGSIASAAPDTIRYGGNRRASKFL